MNHYEPRPPRYSGNNKYDPRIQNTKTGEIFTFPMMCTDTENKAWGSAVALAKIISRTDYYIRSSIKWYVISIGLMLYAIATTIALTL